MLYLYLRISHLLFNSLDVLHPNPHKQNLILTPLEASAENLTLRHHYPYQISMLVPTQRIQQIDIQFIDFVDISWSSYQLFCKSLTNPRIYLAYQAMIWHNQTQNITDISRKKSNLSIKKSRNNINFLQLVSWRIDKVSDRYWLTRAQF